MDMDKKDLRRQMQALRKKLPHEERDEKSAAIIEKLCGENFFCDADTIMLYASLDYEVQLGELMRRCFAAGKRICLPLTERGGVMRAVRLRSTEELAPDAFGIMTVREDCREIVSASEIALVVVPGVAFAADGARLGLGGGYYDRFLPQAAKAYRVALAFDFQLVGFVPAEAHDEKVNAIITESRTIFCKGH